MNKILRRYIITVAAAIVAVALIYLYEVKFLEIDGSIARLLSDSCFVSGVFIFIGGVFAFISNGGGFDAFAYIGHKMRRAISKNLRKEEKKMPEYYDFVQQRRDKGKIPLGHLFAVGLALIAIALILAFIV